MPRPLMFQQHAWQPVIITMRCHQSRLLLRPSDACNRRVLGVIARAMELQPGEVELYIAGATSNHIHIAAAFISAEAKARFKAHIKTNISKELGLLHDWPGSMWERRSRDIHVLDDEAFEDQLMYIAVHGVKEGLSATPDTWPGIPWVRAVTHGKPLVGVWYDRTKLYNLRRAWAARKPAERGPRPVLHDVAEYKTVELTPPPIWAHLDTDALRLRWRALVSDALERFPAANPPLGADSVCSVDPHTRPTKTKRSPAPKVHTRCPRLREAWVAAYTVFVETYRASMQALRAGAEVMRFPPEGCRPVCLMLPSG